MYIVTGSFGVATVRGSPFSPNAPISAADTCLYDAKGLGRDQIRIDRDLLDEAGLGISLAAA